MHRTSRVLKTAIWGLALGLGLGEIAPGRLAAQAQQPPTAAPRGAVVIAINATQRLQASSKKNLKTAVSSKPEVARVTPLATDPTTVLVTGLEPGTTNVTLTDVDDKTEAFEIIVQLDVEYLRTVLRRAIPTANVEPIPVGSNSIILTGHVARSEDVDTILRSAQSVVGGAQVINGLRVGGVMQVQLDVIVALVSRSEFRRMAFNFLSSTRNGYLGSTVGQAVVNPITTGAGGQLTSGGGILGVPGTPNGAPTNILAGVLHDSWAFLGFLQALRDENVVKLLAEPRVVALSGRQASFLSGGEQAIPVPAGLGQVGVQFEEFGTRLNVLPVVLGNGKIHLEVEPEVSSLDAAAGTVIQGTIVPGRRTQRVHTTVELETGQTFVIGGLLQRESSATAVKVPVLGDLPFIGAAFSSKAFEERENELVILVTPRLVDPMTCDQLPKYLPGQETRTPDDFELFLEGILEAPRGGREVFPGRHYVPAYKVGPTADTFPCYGDGGCGNGSRGCGNGSGGCGPNGAVVAPAPAVIEAKPLHSSVPVRSEVAPAAGTTEAPAPLPAEVGGNGSGQ